MWDPHRRECPPPVRDTSPAQAELPHEPREEKPDDGMDGDARADMGDWDPDAEDGEEEDVADLAAVAPGGRTLGTKSSRGGNLAGAEEDRIPICVCMLCLRKSNEPAARPARAV